MPEEEIYTVAKQQKRQSRIRFAVVLCALLSIIFFVLGLGIGRATGSPEVIYTDGSTYSNFDSVLKILTSKFYYGSSSEEYRDELIREAIKGMVNSQGDIHTEYMTPEELEGFSGSLESSFVGVGVRYNEIDGNIFVIDVIYSSPAEKAGILPGDYITAVNGVKCSENDIDDVVKLIPGEVGTYVTLTILRGSETFDLEVQRNIIDSTVHSVINDGIGVVTVNSFGTGTAEELETHLQRLWDNGVRKLIIDLRDNGGGYANTLDKMCAFFMDNGQVVMIEEDRDGNEVIDKVRNSKKFGFTDLVILVNGNSASCSEVFTMALKENCNAITVGTTTYGKGVAQLTKTFPDGSALKYTDVIWKSGNGVYIGGEGITPDYEVWLHDALYMSTLEMTDDEEYGYDSVSYHIEYAQKALDFLGYEVDRNDGYCSQMTADAIAAYQKDNGFEVTSTINKTTCMGLNSSIKYNWITQRDKYDTQMQKAMEIINK